jgi:NarL family two-component system response regulator LiaR
MQGYDDHAVVCSGLSAFLLAFDDLEPVGEAGSGEEAVRLCERLQPDVVLMDLVMPGMDGATATRAIRERWPRVQVIALTSFKEKELVGGALKAGAISCLLKNVSALPGWPMRRGVVRGTLEVQLRKEVLAAGLLLPMSN